jgi:hypothetical protein
MRTLACLPLVFLLLGLFPATAPARTGYPKLLNYFLRNGVTPEEVQELAKWDVLVLDKDFPYHNPGAIAQIRAVNPEIVILGYIPINGPWLTGYQRPVGTVDYKFWEGVSNGDFWLYNAAGGVVSDWPGKGSTNLTPNSPVNSQGQKYWRWFAHFVDDVMWEHGQSEWDGIFLDDVWTRISWLNSIIPSPIDSNRDGTADTAAELDAWWTAANDSCTALLRQLVGPDVPIIGNGANTFFGSLNGTMIEGFPYLGTVDQNNIYGYAWTRWTLQDYGSYFRGLEGYSTSPAQLTTIHSNWAAIGDEPDTTGRFQAHKRIGLATTLLGDGYFAFDNGGHSAIWWEPEYDIYLGAPEGPAYTYAVGGLGIWRRDYTEATVIVNTNNATLTAQAGIPTIAGWDAYIGPRIPGAEPPDTLGPAEVDAYWGGKAIDSHSVFFRWQAVGDDEKLGKATAYQIRYREGFGNAIYEGPTWDAATVVPNTIVPGWAGAGESITIGGLEPGTWYYFAVRAVDEVGHIGPLQVYHYRIQTLLTDPPLNDTIAPAAITTLEATSIDSTFAMLRWTATGDDSISGTATTYRGRIATFPIDAANWDSATHVFWLPTPLAPGTVQTGNVVALAPSTTYYVALRAEDEVPNLSPVGNVLSFTTLSGWVPPPPPPPADTTGPHAVLDLVTLSPGENSLYVRFTAPADDEGTVTAYDIRYAIGGSLPDPAWEEATPVSPPVPAAPGAVQTHAVGGLTPSTTYSFRMRSVDDSGNWGALSATALGITADAPPPPPPPPADTTGPNVISDLMVIERTETALTLSFSAPADAGGVVAAYDLRRVAGDVFTPAQWDTAAVIPTGHPASPGMHEVVSAGSLSPGTTYAFRVRARDEADNWSDLSTAASASTLEPPPPPPPVDVTAPAAIADLTAAVSDTFNITLTWVAPGDDGASGQADRYDLRYRLGALDATTWAVATTVTGTPSPAPAGTTQTLVLEGLAPDITIAFALVTVDDANNSSPMSNVATAQIVSPPPPVDTQPPGAVEDLGRGTDVPGAVALSWTAAPEPDVAHYRIYRSRGGATALTLYQDGVELCEWEDRQVIPGREYVYAVTAVDGAGNEGPRSTPVHVRVPVDARPELPEGVFALGEASPNPSTGPMSIRVETGASLTVSVEVFDISGRIVCGPRFDTLGRGVGAIAWDGRDASGQRVPRGMYFVRVRGNATSELRRVWVLP